VPDYLGQTHRPKQPNYYGDVDKPKKADWRRHEREVAERAGERQVPGSGNQPGKPGDVMGTKFIRQLKATKGAGLSVRAKWLKQLMVQAIRMGRIPVFEIRLEAAESPVPTDWVLIPAIEFQDLCERAKVKG